MRPMEQTQKDPNYNKKFIKLSWEILDLRCEWEDCIENFDSISGLMVHVQTHVNQDQSCDLHCQWKYCSKKVNTLKELYSHILSHAHYTKLKCLGKNVINRKMVNNCVFNPQTCNFIPEPPKDYFCFWDECEEVFQNPECFFRHVDNHAEVYPKGKKVNVTIKCKWKGCKTTMTTLYRLKEHFRTHTQEKVVACPNCGTAYSNRTKLLDHAQRSMPFKDDLAFPCNYCTKKLKSERLLRDHTRGHVNHYKCPYCEMTVPSTGALRSHILYRHSDEKEFSCHICDARAKTRWDLKRHLKTHTDVSLECPIENCLFTAKMERSIFLHLQNVHQMEDQQYICHICNKLFNRGYLLTKHLIKTHGLKWPSGHSRFRYMLRKDGYFHLQTIRYETVDLINMRLRDDEDNSRSDEDTKIDDPISQVTKNNQDLKDVKENMSVANQEATQLQSETCFVIGEVQDKLVFVEQGETLGENSRTIRLLCQNSDGTTTVETAQVIADGCSS